MRKSLFLIFSINLFVLQSTNALACSLPKDSEYNAIFTGKIVEIERKNRVSLPVYTFDIDTWLKGDSHSQVTVIVNNYQYSPGCNSQFVGEVGEVWLMYGNSELAQESDLIFVSWGNAKLKNNDGQIIQKVPRYLIERFGIEREAKGDIYESKIEYQFKNIKQAIRNFIYN